MNILSNFCLFICLTFNCIVLVFVSTRIKEQYYIYSLILWFRMDATLKELTSLVKEVNVESRRKGTFFDFAIVAPDMRSSHYRMRDIGSTCAGRKGVDDGVSLASKRFVIGDYIDIAISPPTGGPVNTGRGPRGRPRPY